MYMVAALAAFATTTSVLATDQSPSSEKRSGVVTMGGKPITLIGDEIHVGEQAPNFTGYDRQMRPVSLNDYTGKVRIVTVFPSIDTKVCSAQTRRFNQEASKLENVQILTVSMDLPFALDRFCAAEGIDNVVTLSDYREREFGLKYGFLIDETRLLTRGTVVIDKDGVVRYVEFVPELGSEPNYDQAIVEAKKLAG
jgi:thiol peroxidase